MPRKRQIVARENMDFLRDHYSEAEVSRALSAKCQGKITTTCWSKPDAGDRKWLGDVWVMGTDIEATPKLIGEMVAKARGEVP
jgi:hypothetical protein